MEDKNVLTVEKIVEEYGKYYENAGQNRSRLVRALMQPAVTLEKNSRRIPTKETVYKAGNYMTGSVVQPYTDDFTPMGNIEFVPNSITLRQVKTDIKIVPNKIEESWLGFLTENNCSIREWPIVRFIMEEYLKNQIDEDRELKMVYNGVYDPGAAEVKPENCLDGIHKLLVTGSTAQYPINIIEDIGHLEEHYIFDQVEAFNKKLPSKYLKQKLTLFMAPEMALEYLKNKREKGYYQIQGDEEIGYRIDFTNHTIFGSPAMAGTTHLWASVPQNILWLTKRYNPISNIQIQVHDRVVKLLLDWWEGLGFACNQMVWATKETVDGSTPSPTPNPEPDSEPETITVIVTAETEAATDVASTGATLNATVTGAPEGAEVTFAYGTDAADLDGEAAGVAGDEGAFSAAVTELTAETKYYCQAIVTANGKTVYGNIVTFTTLAA